MYKTTDFMLDVPVAREMPFDFCKHTTIGCGGFAPAGYFPKTEKECILLLSACEKRGLPYVVLGNLSNVLPADGLIQKVVICTKKWQDARFEKDGVYVSAGVSVGGFLRECETHRKTGAEFLAGVPCTLGGALYMNAGVAGGYIASLVQCVRAWHNGSVITLSADECAYAYKSSVFMQGGFVILGAKLALTDADEEEIQAKKKAYIEKRKHLPKGKSMGCVFKNPQGYMAGKLIEGAGLKGMRLGGAVVSAVHANFILNEDGATSAQIRELIGIVQGAVAKQYNVQLLEEIQYIDG